MKNSTTTVVHRQPQLQPDPPTPPHQFHPQFEQAFSMFYGHDLAQYPEIRWHHPFKDAPVDELQAYFRLTEGVGRTASVKALFECTLIEHPTGVFRFIYTVLPQNGRYAFTTYLAAHLDALTRPLDEDILFTAEGPSLCMLERLIEALVVGAERRDWLVKRSKLTDDAIRVITLAKSFAR